MKRILVLLLLAGVTFASGAQTVPAPPAKVAIISLIGDSIDIVTYRPRVGTHVESNYKQSVPITGVAFDFAAMKSAAAAIAQALPGAEIVTLGVPAAGSSLDPTELVAGSKISATHPLITALQQEKFTHVLVITKLDAAAHFDFMDTHVGSGRVHGLGFYIDKELELQNTVTGETGRGFIAPYAYMQLALIKVEPLQLLGQKRITQSRTRGAAANKTGLDAWGAMSPDEKVESLRKLVAAGVSETTPTLFPAK